MIEFGFVAPCSAVGVFSGGSLPGLWIAARRSFDDFLAGLALLEMLVCGERFRGFGVFAFDDLISSSLLEGVFIFTCTAMSSAFK